eukprot:399592_1
MRICSFIVLIDLISLIQFRTLSDLCVKEIHSSSHLCTANLEKMKYATAPLAFLLHMPLAQGLPMMQRIGPALEFPNPASHFHNRFRQYLNDAEEKDWPSTFKEDDLKEFSRAMRKDTFDLATFHRSSPRYEIFDSPEKFEIKIDVPGFSPQDISIDLKAGGRMLSVIGSHEDEEEEGRALTSKFQQMFTLDPSIITDDLIADLKDEKLTITAPRKIDRLPESRKIEMLINGEKMQRLQAKSMPDKSEKKEKELNAFAYYSDST